MEDLQLNLLDHVCCIIEQNLSHDGDFEDFYKKTIPKFCKSELWEIEEETINLLIFKHYYTMKKIMIYSGAISAVLLSAGIIFKFMHWPGASAGILLGTVLLSLVFLPLMFTLKIKEKQSGKDKLIIGIGTLVGILFSLSILFKILFWPGANMMAMTSLGMLGFLFIPVYFLNGIKNPDTKVNTTVTTVILIAACGLFLALVRSPKASKAFYAMGTANYLKSQRILDTQNNLTQLLLSKDSTTKVASSNYSDLFSICEDVKAFIIEYETGHKNISDDFEAKQLIIQDDMIAPVLRDNTGMNTKLRELMKALENYNGLLKEGQNKIPLEGSFMDYMFNQEYYSATVYNVLNELTQIQLLVLQNQQIAALTH